MPKVKAIRFFISTQFGNVDVGQVLEVSDQQAKAFVSHGFAKLLASDVSLPKKNAASVEGQGPLDFTPPAGGPQERGSSSRAGLVSPKRIVRKSGAGVKKRGKTRAKRKPKK